MSSVVSLAFVPGGAWSSSEDHGYLGPASPYPVGMTPFTLLSADLDADGDLDLATSNFNGSSITTMLNDGEGSFDLGTIPLGHPADLVAVDLNDDGLADLVATVNSAGFAYDFATLLGEGDGTFGDPAFESVGANAGPVAVGDVNGDAMTDLVTTRTWFTVDGTQPRHQFQVHLGDGTGGWADQPVVSDPDIAKDVTRLSDVALVDVEGDDDLDLVMADPLAKQVDLWSNDGLAGFTRTQVVAVGQQTGDMVAIDLDHDDDVDLAVAGSNSGGILVLRNDGSGAFSPAPWSPLDTGPLAPTSMAGSDVNGDGETDLVVTGLNQNALAVLLGDGTGRFAPSWGSPYSTTHPRSVTVGDLDGDGYGDVAVADNANDQVTVRMSLVDDAPPTASLVLDPTTPASGWYTGQVSAQVESADIGSGLAEVGCALDPPQVPTSPEEMPGCPGLMWFAEDGVHHVYLYARDRAGNEAPVADTQVRIDGTAPTVAVATESVPESGWFDHSPTAVVSASDPVSGVVATRCAVDPVDVPTWDEMEPCPPSYLLTGEGSHEVYAAAVDEAGNTSPVHRLRVRVDTVAPYLEVDAQPATVVRGNPVALVPTASDLGSGIASIDCFDAATDQVGPAAASCAAYDQAGNVGVAPGFYTVTPADVSVRLTAGRVEGTHLVLTAVVRSDGLTDAGTLDFLVPSGLRVDATPDGCSVTSGRVTCLLESLGAGDKRSVSITVTPRDEGLHVAEVSVDVPLDPEPDDDVDDTAITPDTICDNSATAGADVVVGTSGPDILCGLGGDDTFQGMEGDDLIFGGPGIDTVAYPGSVATRVDLVSQGLGLVGARPVAGDGQGTDAFTGIENATGGKADDVLIGNESRNELIGGAGADVLRGGAGTDVLRGGRGADHLVGGAGHDFLYGGAGRDVCRTGSDHLVGCER